MAKLKLSYFDFHGGRGEPARLALSMGGVPFEVAVAARIGHAARKVVCAALRGAGGLVTETPFASARVLHLAVRMIGDAEVAADNTRPLPITIERRGRLRGGGKQGADCGD